jgi:hypothetical protein
MGVLDDAIREHLDLKRRHGAEEDELRRQEEEALGPARREVAPAVPEDGEGAASAEVEADAEADLSETIPAQAVRSDVHAADDETELHGELPVDDADPEALHEEPPANAATEVEEFEDEPADTPPQGFETVEEDEQLADDDEEPLEDDEGDPAEEPLEDDEGEPAEEDPDLLEDTPDFLQETPEHDRLWFEQKPPRDFDFD